jgi:phosphoglycolate phosphatase-like HAD superfamily hydrolase
VARLLLFDIDMTLIRGRDPGRGPGRAAIDLAFERVYGVQQASAGVSFDGRTDRGIFSEMIALHAGAHGDAAAAFDAITAAYLAALAETTGSIESVVLPGVFELLTALRVSHPGIGLATGNLERGAALKLSAHGLWEAFATGGFGDKTDNRTELVSDGITRLAAHLGVAAGPADCIVIGDTPLDIAAAHGAGARALGVATGRSSLAELLACGADWAVADLSSTKSVLEILRSEPSHQPPAPAAAEG